jgi:hypothetical protein
MEVKLEPYGTSDITENFLREKYYYYHYHYYY